METYFYPMMTYNQHTLSIRKKPHSISIRIRLVSAIFGRNTHDGVYVNEAILQTTNRNVYKEKAMLSQEKYGLIYIWNVS